MNVLQINQPGLSSWILSSKINILMWNKSRDAQALRKPRRGRSWDFRNSDASQGVCLKQVDSREVMKTPPSLQSLLEIMACWHLDIELLLSKAVIAQISVVQGQLCSLVMTDPGTDKCFSDIIQSSNVTCLRISFHLYPAMFLYQNNHWINHDCMPGPC